jgi:hypothetical protein
MIRIIKGGVSSPTSLRTSGRGWSSSSSSSSSNGIVDELTMEADLFKQRDLDLQTDDSIFSRFYCFLQLPAIDSRSSTIQRLLYWRFIFKRDMCVYIQTYTQLNHCHYWQVKNHIQYWRICYLRLALLEPEEDVLTEETTDSGDVQEVRPLRELNFS